MGGGRGGGDDFSMIVCKILFRRRRLQKTTARCLSCRQLGAASTRPLETRPSSSAQKVFSPTLQLSTGVDISVITPTLLSLPQRKPVNGVIVRSWILGTTHTIVISIVFDYLVLFSTVQHGTGSTYFCSI